MGAVDCWAWPNGLRDAPSSLREGVAEYGFTDLDAASSDQGNERYRLKTPYRDGTTHVIFDPMDFLARIAALVPSRALTRCYGVFAPTAPQREQS